MVRPEDSGREAKKSMRGAMIATRDALPAESRAAASRAIAVRVAALPAFAGASRIALFASIGSEIDTAPIEEAALARHATTFYPRIERDEVGFFSARRADLVPRGRFQIPEPPLDESHRADPATIDLFIVPGLAFDVARRRLGYGRGYYDRLLARAPRAAKIAVAFDAQITAEVPAGPLDIAMDAVVTETRTL